MKKTAVLMTIFIIFLNLFLYKVEGQCISPEEINRINMLLEQNDLYVHGENKEELKRIKEKLEGYEILSQEEKDYVRQCYLDMIRNKLGEEKFNEYCKLIEKRNGTAEFTQPERFRLYQLEKELREIK